MSFYGTWSPPSLKTTICLYIRLEIRDPIINKRYTVAMTKNLIHVLGNLSSHCTGQISLLVLTNPLHALFYRKLNANAARQSGNFSKQNAFISSTTWWCLNMCVNPKLSHFEIITRLWKCIKKCWVFLISWKVFHGTPEKGASRRPPNVRGTTRPAGQSGRAVLRVYLFFSYPSTLVASSYVSV